MGMDLIVSHFGSGGVVGFGAGFGGDVEGSGCWLVVLQVTRSNTSRKSHRPEGHER